MSSVVEKLTKDRHPVEVSLRPERTLEAFRECIKRGFVHIRFTETRGGTELGFRVDSDESSFAGADMENGKGNVRLSGKLTLDYVPVRCIADVDLATLAGQGHLELLPSPSKS